MSIKNRVRALELAQAERVPPPVPMTAKDEALALVRPQKRQCDETLARFIGEPVESHLRESDTTMFIQYELLRVAWVCAPKWLRCMAEVVELERDELPSFTPERIAELAGEYRHRAQLLEDADVPDMSMKGHALPIVAGSTWQERLAWALALGDELDAELRKVNYYDCIESERQRMMTFSRPGLYESPLETVPSLPEWIVLSTMEPYADSQLEHV